MRIAAVTREGPLVQVTTPGQVVAGALTRLEVTATFALANVEVEVPETGERQTLVANGQRVPGVFTPPTQPAPQPLLLRVQGQNGEVVEGTHHYRLRMLGEGVVQHISIVDSDSGTVTIIQSFPTPSAILLESVFDTTTDTDTRFFAVTVVPDGTVFAGGDEDRGSSYVGT
jgi:hypothetical protein